MKCAPTEFRSSSWLPFRTFLIALRSRKFEFQNSVKFLCRSDLFKNIFREHSDCDVWFRWIKHLFSFLVDVIGILQSENFLESLLLANTGCKMTGTVDVNHLNALNRHVRDYLVCQFPSDSVTPERRINCQDFSLDETIDIGITREHVELRAFKVHHLHNLL